MPVMRVLLVALLPLVGLAVYLEGQTYDPAVIRFNPAERTAAGGAFFPDTTSGFRRVGQVRTYGKDNLYEYINGHAEYFISAGFAGLSVGEYGVAGGDEERPALVVDVYDMGSDIQAFGVFSDEVGDAGASLDIGTMAARTSQGISFITGNYYVKIAVFQPDVTPDQLARSIDEGISVESSSFSVFSRFPDLGEIVRTRFIREAYRGLDFVPRVVEREYRRGDGALQVFVVTGGEGEIERLVAAFKNYFAAAGIEYEETQRAGTVVYEVRDPYEGDWFLLPFPDAVYGIFGLADEDVLEEVAQKARHGEGA